MTSGTRTVDQRKYVAGTSGPMIGTYVSKTWNGTDYGSKPPYNRATEHVIERVGLGAGHAREIWHAIAEDLRETANAEFALRNDNKRAAYKKRIREASDRKLARLKSAYERHMAKLAITAARKDRNKAEKEWRKLHGVPFPKALLTASPPRDYVPRIPFVLKVPARVSPRPPKRALLEDHDYTMSATDLDAVLVTLTSATYPTTITSKVSSNSIAIVSGPNYSNLLDAADQNRLVNKLREKLIGSDFNASVFLAESSRTIRMIGDVAIRLAKFLYHVKRGDFYGSARALFEGTSRAPLKPRRDTWGELSDDVGQLAARVLEFQYGVKPLLQDVYSGAQQLAFQLNAPAVKTYRVGIRKEVNQSGTRLHRVVVPAPPPYDWKEIYVTHRQYSTSEHRRNLIARISEDHLPTLPFALGLQDPELVAWEVVPFSFVYDWIHPIGPYLEARSLASHLTGKFITSNKRHGVLYPTSGPYMSKPFCRGDRVTLFTRAVATTLDVEMPTVKTLKAAGTFQHILNGLALLGVAASGKLRNIR